MKRVPSIHITEEVLITLIKEVYRMSDERAERMGKALVEKAKAYGLTSRSVYVTNNKLLQKTEKVKLASRSHTGIFAHQLLLVRRKLKHRGLQLIKPGDKDWLGIKDVTKLAKDFCSEFSIDFKEGCRIYIETGLSMMKNFSYFKFKTIHAAICSKFEAIQEIDRDKTPEETEKIENHYLKLISEKTGWSESYKNNPEKYQHFVKAKEEAKGMGIPFKDYVKAHFDAMEWANAIPDPAQLHGTKARERVVKWAFENGVTIGRAKKTGGNNIFDSIKRKRK